MSAYLGTIATSLDQKFDALVNLAQGMAGSGLIITTTQRVASAAGTSLSGLDITSADSIMESPGTMFMIQQVMSRLKDAMAAIQAAGAVPGQALSQATQAFKQGLN